ncbi:MAG: hypothetical protein FWG69_03330 [Oscillospiraceae bacterium]|nr:hypothetical protein [Oscillospiraceae bacterium]
MGTIKKIIGLKVNVLMRGCALLVAVFVTLSATACFMQQGWAMRIGDLEINSGLYLFMVMSAKAEWQQDVMEENADAGKDFDMYKAKLENKGYIEWTTDRAKELCREWAATETKFDELGLSFTEDEMKSHKLDASNSWNYYNRNGLSEQPMEGMNLRFFETNGIGSQSYEKYYLNAQKRAAIFDKHYEKDGLEEVTEKELKAYFHESYIDLDYIQFPKNDPNTGGLISDEDLTKINKKIDRYIRRINSKNEKFEDIKTEYDEEKAAEAAAAKAAEEEAAAAMEETPPDAASADEENTGGTGNDGTADDGYDHAGDTDNTEDIGDNEENGEDEEDGETLVIDPDAPQPQNNRRIVFKDNLEFSYSEDSAAKIIDEKNMNKAFRLEDGENIYLMFKYDIKSEKTNYTNHRDDALAMMKDEEFNQKIETWAKEMEEKTGIKENSHELGRLTANKLQEM